MRTKIAIPLLLAALLVVLLPLLLRRERHAAGGSRPVTASAKTTDHHPPKAAPPLATENPSGITLDIGDAGAPGERYQDYANRRVAELEDLGMSGDSNALATIESEFDSRDPRIQSAAISAAIQFGCRDAIPALAEASRHTDDPAQKLQFLNAVRFLELPTEGEVLGGDLPTGLADPSD